MFKRVFTCLLSLLLLLPFCVSCAKDEYAGMLVLAQNGQTEYQIVLPADANVALKRTASELQVYLQKISNVLLPVVPDSTEPTEKELRIGQTNRDEGEHINRLSLGEEGFLIRNVGESIVFAGGGDRGTLYSVYSFLEEYLGVRYYTEDVEKIPFLPTLAIEHFADNQQIPSFETRQVSHQASSTVTWNEKQKLNAQSSDDPTPIAGGFSYTGPRFVHTLGTLAGWAKRDNYKHQPCLTDPDVFLTILKNAKKYIEKSPDADIISVSQNDSTFSESGECQCEDCQKAKEKYGASSGLMLEFVNHIASALRADDTLRTGDNDKEIRVETLAYYYTQTPPTGIHAASNVIVRFCNAAACINHAMKDEDAASENQYAKNTANAYENLKGWTEVADTIYVWDYDFDFGCTQAAVPNLDRLYENLTTYATLGVKGVFVQGMRDVGEFDALRAYLSAKLLWNPTMTKEEYEAHMMDFLTGYYGPGAEDIKGYIDYLEEVAGDAHCGMYQDVLQYLPINTTTDENGVVVCDLSIVDRMNELFDNAEAKADTYDQVMRIQKSRIPVLYYEIVSRFATRDKTGESLTDLEALNRTFCEKLSTYSIENLKETLAVPESPNFKNAPLYWGWDGEGVFSPPEKEPTDDPQATDATDATDGSDTAAEDPVVDVTLGENF